MSKYYKKVIKIDLKGEKNIKKNNMNKNGLYIYTFVLKSCCSI